MKRLFVNVVTLRRLVQWGFLAGCLALGLQFGLFVHHFEQPGLTPEYLRPPGVEGFLPIGSLVSLKAWLGSGRFDPVHPAALVLLLTFIGLALLTKNSFCSWICPVGTLEDGLWRLGRKVFGRNFRPWPWLDALLRSGKYLLLAFFVKAILLDMPLPAAQAFLKSPYWALADVKMLQFFTDMSLTVLAALVLLALLSLFVQNAWCRYLCPYGALLGLVSLLSPLKVRRDREHCIDCGSCSRSCPARIDVHARTTVRSVECTACLSCVGRCPQPEALRIGPAVPARALPPWGFALLVLLLFAGGVGLGMLTGHWQTSLTYDDYRLLIPQATRFLH